jgi:predicted DNA-binding transcriptional regulator AlpA
MLRKLIRLAAVREMFGFTKSELYDDINDGLFPPPDCYIGPRSPCWLEETLSAHQDRLIQEQAERIEQRKRNGQKVLSYGDRMRKKSLAS